MSAESLRLLLEKLPPNAMLPAFFIRDTLAEGTEPETPPADLLTVEQAAARMRVSPGYLYRKAKTLPFTIKVSHRVLRFDSVGLEQWLAKRSLKDGDYAKLGKKR